MVALGFYCGILNKKRAASPTRRLAALCGLAIVPLRVLWVWASTSLAVNEHYEEERQRV
jgi:hypothetical protein